MQCQCGSTDIDTDSGRVDSVCRQCGSVLEDCGIVTEVQYLPDSHGHTRAVGQFINFDSGSGGFGHRYGGKESRTATLQNARQNIEALASRLQLKKNAVDSAFNFYKMALAKQLTKGRKNTHVVAACVYMHCRQESTPHMLLDLSEILKINVYELGKTYLKLSSVLCIQAPVLDPALYIVRFAHQLDFGDKEEAVVCVASKLVARMRSDWIHLGRRPSGLCGAALLVAARLHNFNRTIDDIIKVVKVCQATVRKRLNEFSDTPSGKLPIDDFMQVYLSDEQDPPCFKNARRKLRELEDENKAKELEKQVTEIRKEIEKVLEKSKKKSPFENAANSTEYDSEDSSSTTLSSVNKIVAENTVDSLKEIIQDDEEEVVDGLTPIFMQETNLGDDCTILSNDSGFSSQTIEPSLADIGIKKGSQSSSQGSTSKETDNADDHLDLTGVDDEDLEKYFMKPHEYQRKDEVWHVYNADYLKELKEREERKALEEEENAKKPNKRKKKKKETIQGNSAGEVIEKIIQQKKISFKLDYDVLKSLNTDNEPSELSEKKPEEIKIEEATPVPRTTRKKPKPKTPTLVPHNIKKGMSDIIGNSRRKALAALIEEQRLSEEPPVKKQKTEEIIAEINSENEIVEESELPIDGSLLQNNEPNEVEEIEEEEEEDYSDNEVYEMPHDYDGFDEYTENYDD